MRYFTMQDVRKANAGVSPCLQVSPSISDAPFAQGDKTRPVATLAVCLHGAFDKPEEIPGGTLIDERVPVFGVSLWQCRDRLSCRQGGGIHVHTLTPFMVNKTVMSAT